MTIVQGSPWRSRKEQRRAPAGVERQHDLFRHDPQHFGERGAVVAVVVDAVIIRSLVRRFRLVALGAICPWAYIRHARNCFGILRRF